ARRDAVQPAFDALLGVTDQVFPIELTDVERAKAGVQARNQLSARDAIHVAIMQRHGIARILTFDSAFDAVPGIKRINA
ncbi:MAG TPA: type II toxin-antitoxin system VapC family toxin, partial [Gemmatimonadales bacterium]